MRFEIEYVALVLLAIILIAILFYPAIAQDTVTVTIANKERVDGKCLIFTTNETYQCTDILIFGKFDSSDVYDSLQIGQTYTIRVCGFRIPILSEYRNIIRILDRGLQ